MDDAQGRLRQLGAVASTLEAARRRPHSAAFQATVDVALERVQDMAWLLLMCPMYCSDADMWWPVYEKACLFLQLLESLRACAPPPDERDVLLDVYNQVAKLCSGMMAERVPEPPPAAPAADAAAAGWAAPSFPRVL